MARTWLRLGGICTAVVLILSACSSGGSSSGPSGEAPPPEARRPEARRQAPQPAAAAAGSAAAAKRARPEARPASAAGSAAAAAGPTGPIKIWYSNNAEEVAWGKAVVAAWNKDHPNEQVTGEEIPAGKSSEEVIGASITAGNTPCLIFNTAPAAVPQFQKAGRPGRRSTNFPDGAAYIKERTGSRGRPVQFTDGKFYQMPWKTNPVMIFYNKKVFTKAGIDHRATRR